LLNPNRNPQFSREQIEAALRDYLGVREILWLGDGIEGDDTDGHIDDLTRFISERGVLTVIEPNESDPNHAPLEANLERLRGLTIEGKPLEITTLPMPARIDRDDLRLPASYANYYVANQSILLPTFADSNDKLAEEILQSAFPSRKVVPIDCRELIWGLGAFHCLTQQQPAVT
jgi:agmatine deiminase